MAATVNSTLNTFSTNVTGGTVPDETKIRYIEDFVDRLEPLEFPLITRIGFGPAINQRKVEWGQKLRVQTTAALEGALTAAETTITVEAGQGVRFSKYDVWQIMDYVPTTTRLDFNTREHLLVQSVSGDVVTVTRGAGQTSPLAHVDGAFLEKIGSAMTQNSDFALTPVRRGSMSYNYFQRFQQKASADAAARKMPTYEEKGDILLADVREKTLLLKQELERTCWYGTPNAGNATDPEMMGGIDSFITTNRVDLAGALLTPNTFDDLVSELWYDVGTNAGKSLWMDMTTARIIDTFPNPIRRATMTDASIRNRVDKMEFRAGTFEVKHSRNVPPGRIYLLNEDAIKLHPFTGSQFQTKPIETRGPYDEIGIWGEYTMVFKEEPTHAVIEGFDYDLDNYPRDFTP